MSRITKVIDFRGRTPKKLGLDWSTSGYLALSALNVKDGYIDSSADAKFGDQELYAAWMSGNELRRNQVLFTTEAPMGNVAQVPDDQRYILSQRTVAFEVDHERISDDFLAVLLKSRAVVRKLNERASGGTAKGVSQKALATVDCKIADDVAEQTKIGAYFKALDRLIALHQRKHDKLATLKQAMLKKLFPKPGVTTPEIRFAGFEGAWETFSLAAVGQPFTGLTGKSKVDFGHGQARYVTYTGVFSRPILDRASTEAIEIDLKQTQLERGDVLFTTSSETPEEVGMSSVWMDDLENTYLNSFCFGFRPEHDLDSYFLAYALRSGTFRASIVKLAQGISRFNISKRKTMELVLRLPSKLEQQKIGAYFRQLDALISQHSAQLTKLKQLKSAFLKKMFV